MHEVSMGVCMCAGRRLCGDEAMVKLWFNGRMVHVVVR